jgi:sigma54-dependent transcription regulator
MMHMETAMLNIFWHIQGVVDSERTDKKGLLHSEKNSKLFNLPVFYFYFTIFLL